MTDCAHWLEPMLEAERRENDKLAEENKRLRTLLSSVHTLSSGIHKPTSQLSGDNMLLVTGVTSGATGVIESIFDDFYIGNEAEGKPNVT